MLRNKLNDTFNRHSIMLKYAVYPPLIIDISYYLNFSITNYIIYVALVANDTRNPQTTKYIKL